MESILYPKEQTTQDAQQTEEKTAQVTAGPSSLNEKESLKKLLHDKLNSVSKELQSAKDVDRQSKLLDLISKYVEILAKLE